MKKHLFLSLLLMQALCICAQQTRDKVYLKNESVVTGKIIEYDNKPNGRIRIRTEDGNLAVYPASEVVRTQQETIPKETRMLAREVDPASYGSSLSFGPAIGGGGLLGLPVQFRPSPIVALEAGVYYRPLVVDDGYDVSVRSGIALAGGANFYVSREYKSRKQKVVLQGIGFKAGFVPGTFAQRFGSVTWVSERYREGNFFRSFIFELGLGMISYNFKTYEYIEPGTAPLIYWKVNWPFHRKGNSTPRN